MAAHSLKALFLKPQGKVFLASNPLAVRVAPFHIGRIHILISHAESSGGIHGTAVFKECSHGVHVLAVFFGRASYALRVRKPFFFPVAVALQKPVQDSGVFLRKLFAKVLVALSARNRNGKGNQLYSPPDAVVAALYPRLVVRRHKNLESRKKRKILSVQKPRSQLVLACNLLHKTFAQSLSLLGLARGNKPLSAKTRKVVALVARFFHERLDSGGTGVIAEKRLERVQKSAFSVRAASPQNEYTLLAYISCKGVAHSLLHVMNKLRVLVHNLHQKMLPCGTVSRLVILKI